MNWSNLLFLSLKRLVSLFSIFVFLLLIPNQLWSQCCTDNAIEDPSMESSITVDEKFPDAVTTTTNNAKTGDLPEWFYDDGTNDNDWRDANTSVVLPVELIRFSVTDQGCKALFEWTTVNETNLASFEIEHSVDGVDFEMITSITATGGNDYKHYAFTFDTRSEWNIFRLKMIDLDGTFQYSDLKIVEMECFNVSIYPNLILIPNNRVVLNFSEGEAPGSVGIYSELGGLLYSVELQDDSRQILELDLNLLTSGIYYFKFGSRHVERFVILK